MPDLTNNPTQPSPSTLPPKRKQGGQTAYTPEAAEAILEGIAGGKSLRSICKRPGMPSPKSVRRWVMNDTPKGFAPRYARARDMGVDAMVDEAMAIAHRDSSDAGQVARDRLIVDTVKWYASKVAVNRWGDRLHVDLSGTITHELRALSDDALLAEIAALRADVVTLAPGDGYTSAPGPEVDLDTAQNQQGPPSKVE